MGAAAFHFSRARPRTPGYLSGCATLAHRHRSLAPPGRCSPARLPLRDPAEPSRAKLRVCRSHTGRVSPGKGISPALPRSAPPPRRAMAADDDANVPTPAVSEKTPDAATAPAARARSWAEIASAKDETHRTGPDARAPSATIPEATDRASHPPLAVRSGSASNSSLAPPPTPAGLEVVSVSADTVALRWTPGRRGDAPADPSCPTSERNRGAPAAGDENGASESASVDDDEPDDADYRYEVQTSGDGRPGTFVTIAPNVRTCAFVATGLRRGSHHLFRVRAVILPAEDETEDQALLFSEYTSPSLAVKTEDGPPDAPPSAPALVGRATSTTMTVSWHPPAHNGGCRLTRYVIRCWPKTTHVPSDAVLKTNEEEVPVWDGCVLTLTGLEPATAYAVTVSAKNLVGTSAPSEVFVGFTEPATAPAPPARGKSQKTQKSQKAPELGSEIVPFDLTPPARPGECVATSTTSSEIRLEWAPRAGDDGRRREFLVEWRDVGPASGCIREFPVDPSGGEWSVASSPARRRRRTRARLPFGGASMTPSMTSASTTPSSMTPSAMTPSAMSPSRPGSSSSSSSLIAGEEMDCGASSLAGSAPATLYSAAGSSSSSSSSAAAWSDRSSSVDDSADSDRSEGRFTFGSFKRVFVPENGRNEGAVTLEGLRPNRAIQCRIVAVDALTRRESKPGPVTVACTDVAPPPAPAAVTWTNITDQSRDGAPCLAVTWRLPVGCFASDDPASAPTAHVLEMAAASPRGGVRPASAAAAGKRKGRGGKGGKGNLRTGAESSNVVVPPGVSEEDAWTVVYEGEAPRALLRDPPCAPGDAVVFRVRCANAAGFGESSTPVRYEAPRTPPGAVDAPDVVACSPDAVKLRWRASTNANGSVVVAYRAQMRTVLEEGGSGEEGMGTFGEWVDVGDGKATRGKARCDLRVAGLRPATTYQFRVAAVCDDGVLGAFGGSTTAHTPRAPPRAPKPPVVCAVTGTSVTVSFSAADGGRGTTTRDGGEMKTDSSSSSDDEGEDARWRQRTVEYRLEVAGGGFVGSDGGGEYDEDGSEGFACAYRCGKMRERMHRIDGLVPGSRVRIRVRAVGDEGGTSVGESTAARTVPASPKKSGGNSVRQSDLGGDGARARATRAAARAAAASRPVIAAAPAVTRLASSPPRGSLSRRGVQLRRKFRRQTLTAYATACVATAYLALTMYYSWSQ